MITNKSLIVVSSWSHLYLLIKDARSFEYKDIRKVETILWVEITVECHMFGFFNFAQGLYFDK